ncbi:putative chromatin assembly factor 1 subunit B [Coniella lustricola]|uniref:Putative chromatin assembly factor 1 subunit B n=1 Tax=Coniella lustricola TaxID=2025994 RepID=A0A2T3A9V4_9PEZI|nr:putative chromatin assembly factor 1 subunit B [Coniella lustricola]
MKATPLIINWHDQSQPIYSAHFEPSAKGRLATAGGDTNVRLWRIDSTGEERKVDYLATLAKHTQAVNVVRWSPKSETLASAGDDGNVILWVPSETSNPAFGSDGFDDKESWRTKHMCRSSGSEIYDLAWAPDGSYFIIGSMDNVARIYNAATGSLIRQIAEHNHYVQGVAWDPLNEYIATQSSDRSVHVYSLKTKDGHYTLHNESDKPPRVASHIKSDLPAPRRPSSSSPAPPDFGHRAQLAVLDSVPGIGSNTSAPTGSPVPSAPGTPTSMALPMNPPSVMGQSRRSSFSSSRRSVSPAPSMPLPAVMPMEASPKPTPTSMGVRNASLYANETLTSFFRRLTFTPDGSLLLTPAGQYQTQHLTPDGKTSSETVNTVYIYTRGGINKPPSAHLPGHKKPSVCVRCSPIYYTLRTSPPVTKTITIDTSSAEDPIPSLPEPLSKPSPAPSVMEPPPPPSSAESSAKTLNTDATSAAPGPKSAFALPYRMVYAVATQDSILIYDTQQQTPICIVSNLHCATFTDLTWSSDGSTLLVTSSDGFCSAISFSPSDLGDALKNDPQKRRQEAAEAMASSTQTTPIPTPTSQFAPPSPFPSGPQHRHRDSMGSFTAPSPPPAAAFANQRPSSPARSNSTSSVITQTSLAPTGPPTLVAGSVPGLTATNSGKVTGVPITTPPETPRSAGNSVTGQKRELSESEKDEAEKQPKKKRIAPTLISGPGVDPKP